MCVKLSKRLRASVVKLVSCTFTWPFFVLTGYFSAGRYLSKSKKHETGCIVSPYTLSFCDMFEMKILFHQKPNAQTKFGKFVVTNVCDFKLNTSVTIGPFRS